LRKSKFKPKAKSKSPSNSGPGKPNRSQRGSSKKRFGKEPPEGRPGGGRSFKPAGGERPRGDGRKYVGKVQKNPKGFAFIIPLEPGLEDVYVSKEEAGFLMPQDVVEYEVRREGHHRTSAKILRVVKRGQKRLVGRVRLFGKQAGVETSEGEVHLLGGKSAKEFRDLESHWVIADITKYPSREDSGSVEITQVLGPELLPEHDYVIAVARFGLEDRFEMDVLINARKVVEEVVPKSLRRDLRDLPFVTIDGEDAKDFDDAVFVKSQTGPIAFILYVAIADVSSYVLPGSALERSARSRSTSVYFPGMCIPMLPELLSNDVCSLRPKIDRLTLTAEIHYDRDGQVLKTDFYESVIKTARRMTYTELQKYFDRDPKTIDEIAFLKTPLHDLRALYQRLSKLRVERGVLDFELPECRITIDERGNPVEVKPAVRQEAHRLIEEFMIAANSAVAAKLKETGTPSLYRVHDTPKLEALSEINSMLRLLGFSKRLKDLSPRSISDTLSETANLKGARMLHQSILRLQKQARYDPSPDGHFGLALADYTHFTSPIRRYPDLVVHRALKRFIKNSSKPDKQDDIVSGDKIEIGDELALLGQETSERERRAMEAERFTLKRKQCWFMLKHVGKRYRGRVSGLIAKGLFIEIPEFATEGFLPIDTLPGDYEFDEDRLLFRQYARKENAAKNVITLGDELEFEVVDVSIEKNEITFGP
jgi:ribonuclease R